MMKTALTCCLLALSGGAHPAPAMPRPAGHTLLSSIDLSRPFGAQPGWRFTASQGPEVADPLGDADDKIPGDIRLCVSRDGGLTCRPSFAGLLTVDGKADMFSQPHDLNDARIVHPKPDLPLLLIQVASQHSGDGDQRVATTVLRYNQAGNAFIPVYQKQIGRNHNDEIRFMATGPLRGAIISAEPTSNAPFGFWITINKIGPGNSYWQALRYRSATHYGDGNPLAVIDSEMPNLLQRLGLWRMGSPLPLPAGECPQPQLIKQELWCSMEPLKH